MDNSSLPIAPNPADYGAIPIQAASGGAATAAVAPNPTDYGAVPIQGAKGSPPPALSDSYPSAMPAYLWDQAKQGFAGLSGAIGQGINAVMPPGLKVAAAFAKQALTPAPTLSGLITGQQPTEPAPGVGKLLYNALSPADYGQQANQQYGVQNLQTPTDEYGNPSFSNAVLGKIAQFTGASALPSGGVIASAERPLVAAIVEGLGNVSAGLSAEEVKDLGRAWAPNFGIDPDRGAQIGEVLGSFFGPGAIALGAHGVQKVAGAAKLGNEAQQNAAKLLAQGSIKQSMENAPQSAANVAESQDLMGKIPGWTPTLAQQTNAPGIVSIEGKIQSANPANLSQAQAREGANMDALGNYFNNSFPAPASTIAARDIPLGVKPTDVAALLPSTNDVAVSGPKTRYQQIATNLNAQLDATNEHISNLANMGGADQAAVGSELRQLRNTAQDKARGVRDAMYQDVYGTAAAQGVTSDVSDVQGLMKEIAGSDANAAQTMPATYGALKAAIAKYTPEESPQILLPSGAPARAPSTAVQVPFEALHSMYKRAGQDLTMANMAQDYTKAYQIGQVRDLLQQKVNAFEGPQYGDLSNKLQAANQWFATKYAPTFYQGLGGKMSQFNRFGDTTPDENIVSNLIFKRNGQQGMSDFANIYGDDPKASQLLQNGVKDMFARSVVRDGEIKPPLVESFIRDHPQLNAMPDLKKQLLNTDQMNDSLLARRQTIQQQQQMLDQTAVGQIAKSNNPDAIIQKALTDRPTMMALTSQAKTPEQQQAVSRAIATAVSKQADPYAFLQNNAPTLRRPLEQLGKGHFDNLLNLARASDISARTRAPTSVPMDTLQDIGTATVGTPVKGLFSMARNVAKHFMSPIYAAMDVGGRYIYKVKTDEANRLLNEAIYDPDAAKSLLAAHNNPTPQNFNSLRNHAFSHGVKIIATAKASNQ